MSYRLLGKHSTRTTHGMLSKGWYDFNGRIVLVKGNTKEGYEPYSEVMACTLFKLLGLRDVLDYWILPSELFPDIEVYDSKHVSLCYSFLSPTEDFESIYSFVRKRMIMSNKKDPDWEYVTKALLSIEMRRDMFFGDAVVGNDDRHINNFGVITSMGNYVRTAPIFDNGCSLLSTIDDSAIEQKSWKYRYDKSKPFRTTHKAQLKLFGKPEAYNRDITIDAALSSIENVLDLLPKFRVECVKRFLSWRWEEYVSKDNV